MSWLFTLFITNETLSMRLCMSKKLCSHDCIVMTFYIERPTSECVTTLCLWSGIFQASFILINNKYLMIDCQVVICSKIPWIFYMNLIEMDALMMIVCGVSNGNLSEFQFTWSRALFLQKKKTSNNKIEFEFWYSMNDWILLLLFFFRFRQRT